MGKMIIRNVVSVLMVLIIGLAFLPEKAEAAVKKPAKVSGMKVTKVTTTTVEVSWKKAKRAKGYCVYKSEGGTKKWSKVATTKSRNVTVRDLKSGEKYSFKVRAYTKKKGKKIWGKYSAAKTVHTEAFNQNTETRPVPVSQDEYVLINERNFPDPVFRNRISKVEYDKDQDGKFSPGEIASIKRLNFRNQGIKTLKGIEHFTFLEVLDCGYGMDVPGLPLRRDRLATLDLSNNKRLRELYCDSNQLMSLDLSKNTVLEKVFCHDNQISSLNVNGCVALECLVCRWNDLTNLDVSNNRALVELDCEGNQLQSLYVSNNTALEYLICGDNDLTNLDVSNNRALVELNCEGNQLQSLYVSNNTALEYLMCGDNDLTSLDVSNNTALGDLSCDDDVDVIGWPRENVE